MVTHKLLIDGDADALTGPSFGRVRSLVSAPTIGNGQRLRILWELAGEEAIVWALALVDDFDADEDEEPEA